MRAAGLRKRLRGDLLSTEELWEETEQFVRDLPSYLRRFGRERNGQNPKDRSN